MQKILVIEDSKDCFVVIQRALAMIGLIVWAQNLEEAEFLLNSKEVYDLIILDVNLPDGSGYNFLNKIKQNEMYNKIPVIILSGLLDVDVKVTGFKLGIEDYVTKPFDFREFKARIERVLAKTISNSSNSFVRVAGMLVDKDMQRIKTENGAIELTSTEFKILMLLAQHSDKILDREMISKTIWADDESNVRQVDTHVSKLRKKIGSDKILSIYNQGYKIAS